MELSYNNFWKTLINKGVKKGTLCRTVQVSISTVPKMKRGELVPLTIILKISKALNCDIENVVAVVSSY